MSFLGKVGRVVSAAFALESKVAPLVAAVYPPAAPFLAIASRVQQAIVTVEASIPAEGQGPVKASMVVADFESGFAVVNSVLALRGDAMTYDPAKLQTAINAQVAANNAMAELAASFEIKPLSGSHS